MTDSVELRRPDLAELRALLEAATKGEWTLDEDGCCVYGPDPDQRQIAMVSIGGADGTREDAALIVAMHAALPQLVEACEKALWALEIAKYRLDGHMAYPGEPNSITEAMTLLKSLGFGVPGSLVEPTPSE